MEKQEIINKLLDIIEERVKGQNLNFNPNNHLSLWQIKRFLSVLSVELLQNIYQNGNPLTGLSSGDSVLNFIIYSKRNKKNQRLSFTLTDYAIITHLIDETLAFVHFGYTVKDTIRDIDFDEILFQIKDVVKNFLD